MVMEHYNETTGRSEVAYKETLSDINEVFTHPGEGQGLRSRGVLERRVGETPREGNPGKSGGGKEITLESGSTG